MLERLASTARLASLLPALARFRPDGRYNVADRLEERARSYGEATFLAVGERRISFRETDARANRVAHWALARGIRKGDVVALLMENRPEYIFSWGGLAKLGAISALINTNLGGRALDHALQTAGTRQLVVGSECLERLASASPEVLAGLGVNVVFHKVSQRPGKPMWFGVGPDNKAVFALPGNPVSALVCCRQYVLPALEHASAAAPQPPEFASLAGPVTFKPKLTCFQPVRLLSNAAGQLLAMPVKTNTSGDFTALSATDGYVELAREQSHFPAGTAVFLHRWHHS